MRIGATLVLQSVPAGTVAGRWGGWRGSDLEGAGMVLREAGTLPPQGSQQTAAVSLVNGNRMPKETLPWGHHGWILFEPGLTEQTKDFPHNLRRWLEVAHPARPKPTGGEAIFVVV